MSKHKIEVFPIYGALCYVDYVTAAISFRWHYVDSVESEDGSIWDIVLNVKTGEYGYTDLSMNDW